MARRKKIAELEEIFEKVPEDRKYIGRDIVEELIFLKDTLKKLKRAIKENGTKEVFINGKQKFIRESADSITYNKYLQRFDSLYKHLNDLLPKAKEPEKANGVYDFIKGTSSQ